jgi:hypothetical protein
MLIFGIDANGAVSVYIFVVSPDAHKDVKMFREFVLEFAVYNMDFI